MSPWRKTRLRHHAVKIGSGKTPSGGADIYTANGISFLRSLNVYDDGIHLDDLVFIPADVEATMQSSRVREGDVLLNITGASIGRACVVDPAVLPANVNQHVCIIRTKGSLDHSFLALVLQSSAIRDQINAVQQGSSREGLNFEQVADLTFGLPELATQRAVVERVKRAVDPIDEIIRSKYRMIRLAEERRRGVVQAAVLRGLDAASGRQESGVPTLGSVPAHWTVLRNKTLIREVVELSTAGSEELLTVSHITGVTPRSEKNVTMSLAESMEGYKRVETGDLVINTMWAWMGALGTAPCPGIVSPAYGVYRLDLARMVPAFFDLFYRTPAYVAEMTRHSRGVWSSRLRLYPESFLALRTVVPPLAEQRAVLAYIETEVGHTHDLITKLLASIEKLREYRRALIGAAVLGPMETNSADVAVKRTA